jgi:hypothetical protein
MESHARATLEADEPQYRMSLWLQISGVALFVAILGSIWFVDEHRWLFLVPLAGGALLWMLFLLDMVRQRATFFVAMRDASTQHGGTWKLLIVLVGGAYGFLMGYCK